MHHKTVITQTSAMSTSFAAKKRKISLKPAPNFPSLRPAIKKRLAQPVLTQQDLDNRHRLLEILQEGDENAHVEKTKPKPVIGGSMKNFYETLSKEYKQEEETYETQDQVKISLPFRMLIVGASGSGKTNMLMNLIKDINAFDRYYLYAKALEEPLYKFFIDSLRKVEKKTGTKILEVSDNIKSIVPVSSLNKNSRNLLIVDDMVQEKSKDLAAVGEHWIRGRKENESCIFISQSYYGVPSIMRKNSDLIVLKKISTNRDLQRISAEYTLNITEDTLRDLYNASTAKSKFDFLLIDLATNDANLRFRHNYAGIPESSYNPSDEAPQSANPQ